jgi:lysozyme
MDQTKTDGRLEADEGTGPLKGGRLVVYDDATGKAIVPGTLVKGHPTIGFGRALDVNGLSMAEALLLLHDDEGTVTDQLDASLPWWKNENDVRQAVLISLAFNMGIAGLLQFHNTLAAWQAGRYALAAEGMKDSVWYGQVGKRGPILVTMVLTGEWPAS